jgi:hypothetical protein
MVMGMRMLRSSNSLYHRYMLFIGNPPCGVNGRSDNGFQLP